MANGKKTEKKTESEKNICKTYRHSRPLAARMRKNIWRRCGTSVLNSVEIGLSLFEKSQWLIGQNERMNEPINERTNERTNQPTDTIPPSGEVVKKVVREKKDNTAFVSYNCARHYASTFMAAVIKSDMQTQQTLFILSSILFSKKINFVL